jgi:hypothetical protein
LLIQEKEDTVRTLLLVLITAGSLLLQVTMARATDVQGTFSVEPPTIISVTPDDDDCNIVLDEAFIPAGDLQGRMNSHFRIEHMGPCGQPAPETFEARGTFTGSVLGATGSFRYTFEGTIDAQNNAQGTLQILSGTGTGGLAGLRGEIHFMGTVGVGGTYSGDVDFD